MHTKRLCFYFIIFLVTVLSKTIAEENILIVTEEWAPFNYLEDQKLTGFSVEIVENILKRINRNYEIKLLPSLRSTITIKNRPQTIMFSLFKTPEREDMYKWVGPLCDGSIYFYKRRDNNIIIKTLDDIKNVGKIACRHGGIIPKILLEYGFNNLDMGATGSIGVYIQLIKGRCDLAISDTDLGMRYYLKLLNEDVNIFEKIPIKIFESELYIAFRKDISDEEVIKWQNALDELKKDGTYQKIFDSYQL